MFNFFKFNQNKFNSKSVTSSVDVVINLGVLNIASSVLVPIITVPAFILIWSVDFQSYVKNQVKFNSLIDFQSNIKKYFNIDNINFKHFIDKQSRFNHLINVQSNNKFYINIDLIQYKKLISLGNQVHFNKILDFKVNHKRYTDIDSVKFKRTLDSDIRTQEYIDAKIHFAGSNF